MATPRRRRRRYAGDPSERAAGDPLIRRFWSLQEYVAYVTGPSDMQGYRASRAQVGHDWCRDSWDDALRHATEGEPLPTRAIADVSSTLERNIDRTQDLQFLPEYGVAGSEVDVARYLTGDPDCMIDYPQVWAERYQEVVTVCISAMATASVPAETLQLRGALALSVLDALTHLRIATEIWIDQTVQAFHGPASIPRLISYRTRVRAADELLDLSAVAFAAANESMLRRLFFAGLEREDKPIRDAYNVPGGYGRSHPPIPEGWERVPHLVIPSLDKHSLQTWENPELAIPEIIRQLAKRGIENLQIEGA